MTWRERHVEPGVYPCLGFLKGSGAKFGLSKLIIDVFEEDKECLNNVVQNLG